MYSHCSSRVTAIDFTQWKCNALPDSVLACHAVPNAGVVASGPRFVPRSSVDVRATRFTVRIWKCALSHTHARVPASFSVKAEYEYALRPKLAWARGPSGLGFDWMPGGADA